MSKRKPAEPLVVSYSERVSERALKHSLTMRLSKLDLDKLTELRLALHARSNAETVRALIELYHSQASRAALRQARKARGEVELRRTNPKQLPMFGGTK